VLERRRPGGSDLAIIGQGSQADLSLPSSCEDVSYSKAQQLGLRHWLGIRKDEGDNAGIGASRGKSYLAQVRERRLW